MQGKTPSAPDYSRYKRLAEAVLTQAIKDATHEYRRRILRKSVSKPIRRAVDALSRNQSSGAHFLLEELEYFTFWCEVAELSPEVVREKLKQRLYQRKTRNLIRATGNGQ